MSINNRLRPVAIAEGGSGSSVKSAAGSSGTTMQEILNAGMKKRGYEVENGAFSKSGSASGTTMQSLLEAGMKKRGYGVENGSFKKPSRQLEEIRADIDKAQKDLDLINKTTIPFFEAGWHKESRQAAQSRVDALKSEWKDAAGWDYDAYADNTSGITKAINKTLDVGGDAAMSGISEFTTGVANTADLLGGTFLEAVGWKNNPLRVGAEIMNRYNAELAQQVRESAGDSKAAQTAAQVLASTVAAAPMAVMALLTGGASAATSASLEATAASQGASVAQMVGQSVSQMMKDPNYWTSFLQEAGNNFREAQEWAGSDEKAAIYALTVGLVNSGIEVGLDGASGIQGLERAVRQGNTAGLRQFLDSVGGEALEEIEQGVVSRGVGQLFGSGAKTFSMTDSNAVINPKTMLEEGAMGGAVGALLTGGTHAVNAAVQRAASNPLIQAYDMGRARQEAVKTPQNVQEAQGVQTSAPRVENAVAPSTALVAAAESQTEAAGRGNPLIEAYDWAVQRNINGAVSAPMEGQKNTALSAGVESLVSAENMARYRQEIDGVFDGSLPEREMVFVGDTPALLQQYGASNRRLVMTQDAARKIAYPSGYQGGEHNLGLSSLKNLPYQIADPLAILKSKTIKNSLVILTEWQDTYGNSVVIPIHLDRNGSLSLENRIPTAYGKRNIGALLGEGYENVVYTKNNEDINTLLANRLQLPTALEDDVLYNPSISQKVSDVNPQSDPGMGNTGFHNIGAAERGFTTPTRGEMVPTQNKTVTQGVGMAEADRAAYAPDDHERISGKMSLERAGGLFYQDESGNIVNVEDTVDGLLDKDAWTGVEQDAAQMAFRIMRGNINDLTTEQYDKFRALVKAMQGTGGTEAGRSLQARQKWVDSGNGIVEKTMSILEDPRIDQKAARKVMRYVTNFAERYDYARESGNIDSYLQIVREAALERNTSKTCKNGEIKKTAELAMKQIKATGDVEFARNAARASIIAMAQDYVPVSRTAKLKAFRRDAMLSKISTWARNVVSNNVFDPIDSISRDISVPLDMLLSKFTKTRSVDWDASWFSKAKRSGSKYGAAKSFLEVALDISAEGAENRYGQAGNRTFHMNGGVFERFMSQWEKISNYAMYSTDQMQKGGIQSVVQRGIDRLYKQGKIADDSLRDAGTQEAAYRTFQADTGIAKGFLTIRQGLNEVAHIGDVGLGDFMMPFVQVPTNLVDITIDYSPAGLAKGIVGLTKALYDAHNGTMTAAQQARAVQTIGRSLTGSSLVALAVLMRVSGVLLISDDGREEDKDKTALESQSGLSGTQINLSGLMRLLTGESAKKQPGDKLMSIGFMDPFNALLNMGGLIADDYIAEHEGEENGITIGEIFKDTVAGTVQAAAELPMMDPFADAINAYNYSKADTVGGKLTDAGLQFAAGLVSSFIPNSLKGIAQGTDTKQRDLYSSGTLLGRTWDSIKAGIPGLRQTLPAKLNSFGEEMDVGNPALNFLNNNILPGSIVQYTPQKPLIEEWFDNLYSAMGAVTQYPDKNPPNSISKDTDGDGKTEKFSLSSADKRQYKTTYGGIIENLVSQVYDRKTLFTKDEALEILTGIKSYAGAEAKKEFFKENGINAEVNDNYIAKAVLAVEEAKIPFVTYLDFWCKKDKLDYEVDEKGHKKVKEAVVKLIDSMKLTDAQKDWLYNEEGYKGHVTWH